MVSHCRMIAVKSRPAPIAAGLAIVCRMGAGTYAVYPAFLAGRLHMPLVGGAYACHDIYVDSAIGQRVDP